MCVGTDYLYVCAHKYISVFYINVRKRVLVLVEAPRPYSWATLGAGRWHVRAVRSTGWNQTSWVPIPASPTSKLLHLRVSPLPPAAEGIRMLPPWLPRRLLQGDICEALGGGTGAGEACASAGSRPALSLVLVQGADAPAASVLGPWLVSLGRRAPSPLEQSQELPAPCFPSNSKTPVQSL